MLTDDVARAIQAQGITGAANNQLASPSAGAIKGYAALLQEIDEKSRK